MARNEKEKKQKAKKTPHWFCTIYDDDDDDDILLKSSSSRIDSVSQIILSCSTYMCVCVCHNTQAFFMDKRWTVFYITIMFTRHTHTHIKWIFEGPFSRFLSFWKCWHPLIENVRSFHHLTVVWITEQGKKTCSSSIHDDDDNNRNHHTSWWMIMLVPQQQQQQESFSNIFLQEFQCSHHSQVSQSVLKTKKKRTRSWMKEKKYPNDLIIIGKKKAKLWWSFFNNKNNNNKHTHIRIWLS